MAFLCQTTRPETTVKPNNSAIMDVVFTAQRL